MRSLLIPAIAMVAIPFAAPADAQQRGVRTMTRGVTQMPQMNHRMTGHRMNGHRTVVRHSRWHRAPGGWNAYRHPVRGWALPSYWIAPTHYIGNYASYGLPVPEYGYRWQRYYDDAVMVDPRGNVQDSRQGIAWDDSQDDAQDDGYYADREYDDGVYDDRTDDDRVTYRDDDRAAYAPPPPPAPPRVTFAPSTEVVQGGSRAHPVAPPSYDPHYRDGYEMAQEAGADYPPPREDRGYGPPPRYADDDADGPPPAMYEDEYRHADGELAGYRERYAPPPVVTHTGPGRVTTTTSYAGQGYIANGYYFPPATTTTVVVSGGCHC